MNKAIFALLGILAIGVPYGLWLTSEASHYATEVSEKRDVGNQTNKETKATARTRREDFKSWFQAVSPAIGGIALALGLLFTANQHRRDEERLSLERERKAIEESRKALEEARLGLERQRIKAEWYSNFRSRYESFWSERNESMAMMRSWIANTDAYVRELQPVLQKRLDASRENTVTAEEYKKLEVVDRFGALLVTFFRHEPQGLETDDEKRWQVLQVFDQYWIDGMYKRVELAQYMAIYWKVVMSEVDKLRSKQNPRPT